MADERAEIVETRKLKSRKTQKASAGTGGAAAGGAGGGGGGGDDDEANPGENPSVSEILKMSPTNIAGLQRHLLVMLPATWLDYVWAGPPAERVDRHRALKEAVTMAAGLHAGAAKTSSEIHPMDTDRVLKILNSIFDLMDPATGPLDQKHRGRIRADIRTRGLEIVAYREARNSGWKVARRAIEIYTADSQVDKLWTQAVKAAAAQVSGRSGGGGGGAPKPQGKRTG